jgi:cytidylate kinase
VSREEPVITIDGPAGAGKSTAARALAGRLGFRFLDTGAMYRAVAVSVATAGIDPDDLAGLRAHLGRLRLDSDGSRVSVDGRDVTAEIRTGPIAALTSRLTALGPVRDTVTPLQRRLAAAGGVVLEGRDTGSVVCPDAEVKFYLDATLNTRAHRRHAELARAGAAVSLETVREDIADRDALDMRRELAPLVRPPDAITIDTTNLTVDEIVDTMLAAVERRRCSTRS